MLLKVLSIFLVLGFLVYQFSQGIFFNLNILGITTPAKSTYSIAIYGDSMVDTMGENLDYLQASLKRKYPGIKFNLYNYGIGGENVEQGLNRFHSPFSYKTRNYPPIPLLHPDIIIIASFAYNPFSPHNRDRHWQTLTTLVNQAKATGSEVYLLSEIAPLKSGFGKGPNGVNWPEGLAYTQSSHIVEQLENVIYLAQDHLKVSLINVYQASLADGKFGQARFVNPSDGIHPSVEGQRLTAEMIASKIRLK